MSVRSINKRISFRWLLIISVLLIITGLFYIRLRSFKLDTDLISYLPKNDPVLTDAGYVIRHLPYQDKVVIDVSTEKPDREGLVQAAGIIEDGLSGSGFFKKIGIEDMQMLIPALIGHIVKNLPVMFTEAELKQKIEPLLSRAKINDRLAENLKTLGSLDGIGQAEYLTLDPLGFKNIVLSKLSGLSPAQDAKIYKGKILSSDEKHLLIIAEMKDSGMDLKSSEAIDRLITGIAGDVKKSFTSAKHGFTLNPVGAYRAVLDNQNIIKKDSELAATVSTIVIALLLILGFPRPFLGLLALVPSVIGTAAAFIVYSLMHDSLSILALGFGGVIISFTADYGITYLLFLDQAHETTGLKATKESWSLGFLAMLTSAVSFAFMFISGFPVLTQIGEFATWGVLFSYVCVHTLFPAMFPVMKPAKRGGIFAMRKVVNLISAKVNFKFYAAAVFCVIMLFFARPAFRVDLDSMNSVSKETLYSENLVVKTWGDLYNRVYLMTEGRSVEELQDNGDNVAEMLAEDTGDGPVSSALIPSMIYPGKKRMNDNFNAWRKFWTTSRVKELKNNIRFASGNNGFSKDAFDGFFKMIEQKVIRRTEIPSGLYSLFGISKISDSKWMQLSIVATGNKYDSSKFYSSYTGPNVKLFDPELFSERLGGMLMSGFIKMAVIVGIISFIVALLYLFDLQLTLIAMLPTVFAVICTFATLNIMGQPLGIPTIMVIVAVIGMGTDYAIYFVRSYQRYLDENNPSLKLVQTSVLLSFATALAGFGVLAFSQHALLKSAGMCLGFGLLYSFIGSVCIVPFLLQIVYKPAKAHDGQVVPGSKEHFRRVMDRYKHLEASPRFFAYFKMRLGSMFPKLAEFVHSPKKILDLRCGYGLQSVWLLELYPGARVFAFDPDERHVFIASMIIGSDGIVKTGRVPDLSAMKEKFDTVLLLGISHYLTDDEFKKTLKSVNARLSMKGRLILRAFIPSEKKLHWVIWLEYMRIRFLKINTYFRNGAELKKLIQNAGFNVKLIESSGKKRKEMWIIADKQKAGR